MTEFKYLGTIIEANGSIQREVEDKISKVSRVFGALKGSVFSDSDLSLAIKRLLYRAVMLGVLLYGSTPLPFASFRAFPHFLYSYASCDHIIV